MKTIHEVIADKTDLAKTYAEDGAFYTAAQVLTELSQTLKNHAAACEAEMMRGHTAGVVSK